MTTRQLPETAAANNALAGIMARPHWTCWAKKSAAYASPMGSNPQE